MNHTFEIRFKIQSSPHYLSFLRQMLPAINKCGDRLPIDVVRGCTLAMVEAVDNAIFHAHKGRLSKWIEIGVCIRKGRLSLTVSDEGAGFFIKDVKEPSLYQTHGRGVFIMKKLADTVEYNNNTLKMVKWLNG